MHGLSHIHHTKCDSAINNNKVLVMLKMITDGLVFSWGNCIVNYKDEGSL